MRHKDRFPYGNTLFYSSEGNALLKGTVSKGIFPYCRWSGEGKQGVRSYFAEAVCNNNDFLEADVLIPRLTI